MGGCLYYRPLSACSRRLSWNVAVRSDDRRGLADWSIEIRGSGIYLLPGNSCDVWSKLSEAAWIRLIFHPAGIEHIIDGNGGFICGISAGDTVFDGIYQET